MDVIVDDDGPGARGARAKIDPLEDGCEEIVNEGESKGLEIW
jgi:hypothetical protein